MARAHVCHSFYYNSLFIGKDKFARKAFIKNNYKSFLAIFWFQNSNFAQVSILIQAFTLV